MKWYLASILLTLVTLNLELTPVVAPFPPEDPRAVFNAFIIPWWPHAPRWLREHIHLHWTGDPLPPDARRRHQGRQKKQIRGHRRRKPVRRPISEFLARFGIRRKSQPWSLIRAWNRILDKLLKRRRSFQG